MPTLASPAFYMIGQSTESTLDVCIKVMSLENVSVRGFQPTTPWAAVKGGRGQRWKTLFLEEVCPFSSRGGAVGHNGEIGIPSSFALELQLIRDKLNFSI